MKAALNRLLYGFASDVVPWGGALVLSLNQKNYLLYVSYAVSTYLSYRVKECFWVRSGVVRSVVTHFCKIFLLFFSSGSSTLSTPFFRLSFLEFSFR